MGNASPSNPLTPKLNPSTQWQPAESFYWGFQFLMHALRKKGVSQGIFLEI
jgi:hypothetical protein